MAPSPASQRAARLRPMQQRTQPRYQYYLSLPSAYHQNYQQALGKHQPQGQQQQQGQQAQEQEHQQQQQLEQKQEQEQKQERLWPLILFLHGAGEGGPGGLEKVKLHGVPRLVAAHCGEEAARKAGSRPEPVNMECAELVGEGAITVSPQQQQQQM
ncbi:hypothetical protein VOLCADRAFT_89372 [Volvox carteri f. nagariensis]|uniref:Phospholipase/carboxylesterase/thioesterase domain-containing protein n=1 Tax=Volvox carteri f. nagariensis TaxID=3068 RepID=D8TRJ0_VOLCA|nr:uncharacterized protein VOLCADRAFT_89372 [Volvox carteri f. nagariensis]EFJ50003.1 hypothetical protein VOLCADRAFT_89372 [Volvox carteri f. nagariensis]|eukprot:XP_002949068.1 hypothetical protein VOLCADRAFT_89372 [Volvox carteri f. nagariensis]